MRSIRTALAAIALAAAFAVAAVPARAGLLGETFTASYRAFTLNDVYGPASFAPTPFVAGPGLDTVGMVEGVTTLDVDILDSGLTVTFGTILANPTWSTASFNGIVLTAASPLALGTATVDAATTLAGFGADRVTVVGNEIRLDWNGRAYTDGTVLSVSFAAVPEPASLALFGAGLLGLGLARRRGLARA